MRIGLVALIGLVVGLGAGTGVSALRVKGEMLEARAQAHADSLAAGQLGDPGHGDEGGLTVVLPPEEAAPASDSLAVGSDAEGASAGDTVGGNELVRHAATGDTAAGGAAQHAAPGTRTETAGTDAGTGEGGEAPGATPGVGEAEQPVGAEVPADAVLNPAGAKKLAKIFAAMRPADAAAVLAGMTDEEVTAILGQMADRQAGPVVSAFPAERAAVLSSGLLRARGGGS